MTKQVKSRQVTRRRFVGGTLAGGAMLMGAGTPVFASAGSRAGSLSTAKTGGGCHPSHVAISEKLSQTIADPAVDATARALAIRTSHCPCCGTQIGADFHAEGVAA